MGDEDSVFFDAGRDDVIFSQRFENVTLLGNSSPGSHCVLYKAMRRGKWFVLKTLKPCCAADPLFRRLLVKEFEIGYGLSHPNVAQTLGMEEVPDRYCRVVYLGSGSFRILEARNSKIKVGDTFCTGLFSEGNPLYMTNLQHEGNTAPKNYVAGMRNGIKNLKLKKRSIIV